MFIKEKMLPIVILSILLMTFGFVHNGWSQSSESAEPNENEIILGHSFGKVEHIPTNDHLQATNSIRPDQLRKQIIVVNADRFFVTPQTTFFDIAGDVVNERVNVQEGEMISFAYNQRTKEIVELHREDLNENNNDMVFANDTKENSEKKAQKPKQTIIFENGVYRNVPVK